MEVSSRSTRVSIVKRHESCKHAEHGSRRWRVVVEVFPGGDCLVVS